MGAFSIYMVTAWCLSKTSNWKTSLMAMKSKMK